MKRVCKAIFFLCSVSLLLTACTTEPKAIVPGKDNCDYCRMTVSDQHYSCEILTQKGKVYIFDDIHCMISFVKEKNMDTKTVKDFFVSDYSGNHSLIKATQSFLFTSDELHSPMGGNTAAFAISDAMQKEMQQLNGKRVTWTNLIK